MVYLTFQPIPAFAWCNLWCPCAGLRNTESSNSESSHTRKSSNGKGVSEIFEVVVEPTHLKNTSQNWFIFPKYSIESEVKITNTSKPPPSFFLDEIHFPLAPEETSQPSWWVNTTCKVVGISKKNLTSNTSFPTFSVVFIKFIQVPYFSKNKGFVCFLQKTPNIFTTHIKTIQISPHFFSHFGKIRRHQTRTLELDLAWVSLDQRWRLRSNIWTTATFNT